MVLKVASDPVLRSGEGVRQVVVGVARGSWALTATHQRHTMCCAVFRVLVPGEQD